MVWFFCGSVCQYRSANHIFAHPYLSTRNQHYVYTFPFVVKTTLPLVWVAALFNLLNELSHGHKHELKFPIHYSKYYYSFVSELIIDFAMSLVSTVIFFWKRHNLIISVCCHLLSSVVDHDEVLHNAEHGFCNLSVYSHQTQSNLNKNTPLPNRTATQRGTHCYSWLDSKPSNTRI